MSLMSKISSIFRGEQPLPTPAPLVSTLDQSPLSARQIALVRSTWEKVIPIADQAASLFYNKLFDLDPDLKVLFNTDIEAQGKKLMQMITVAVKGLDHLDAIVPAVQQLGKRHVRYGVKDDHYDTVARALLWTLEQGLGYAFTPEVQLAWATTYHVLATTMKEAAAEVE